MDPTENDGRRFKQTKQNNKKKRAAAARFSDQKQKWDSNVWKRWRERKSEGLLVKRVQSGESDTAGRTGWSDSPPASVSLGGWHFSSSVWPLTEGGDEWRSGERVKERDEQRRKRAIGRWAADRRLNARLPICWDRKENGTPRRFYSSWKPLQTFDFVDHAWKHKKNRLSAECPDDHKQWRQFQTSPEICFVFSELLIIILVNAKRHLTSACLNI